MGKKISEIALDSNVILGEDVEHTDVVEVFGDIDELIKALKVIKDKSSNVNDLLREIGLPFA